LEPTEFLAMVDFIPAPCLIDIFFKNRPRLSRGSAFYEIKNWHINFWVGQTISKMLDVV